MSHDVEITDGHDVGIPGQAAASAVGTSDFGRNQRFSDRTGAAGTAVVHKANQSAITICFLLSFNRSKTIGCPEPAPMPPGDRQRHIDLLHHHNIAPAKIARIILNEEWP